ncbi:hypothetical protein [Bacillus manliponensis]|uniref:hypothetical protein n=1 Tax=Bacillus manliponensis TaxID=574376 RepID=UPI003518774A
MKYTIWGSVLLGSMLLLTGCVGNEPKKEVTEKVEQPKQSSEDNAEDLKVYNEIHEKYEDKLNKEVNEAMQLWEVANERSGKAIFHPDFKKDVQEVTEIALADIEHIRSEIRVPESKKHEHGLYVGFLDESEKAMKKLDSLAKDEDVALLRDIEVHLATAVTYYNRFKAEQQSNK